MEWEVGEGEGIGQDGVRGFVTPLTVGIAVPLIVVNTIIIVYELALG